jgi:hypothetical protein
MPSPRTSPRRSLDLLARQGIPRLVRVGGGVPFRGGLASHGLGRRTPVGRWSEPARRTRRTGSDRRCRSPRTARCRRPDGSDRPRPPATALSTGTAPTAVVGPALSPLGRLNQPMTHQGPIHRQASWQRVNALTAQTVQDRARPPTRVGPAQPGHRSLDRRRHPMQPCGLELRSAKAAIRRSRRPAASRAPSGERPRYTGPRQSPSPYRRQSPGQQIGAVSHEPVQSEGPLSDRARHQH